jgi:hypothetical protein
VLLPNCQPVGELVLIVGEVAHTHIASAHRISGFRKGRESNPHVDCPLKTWIL